MLLYINLDVLRAPEKRTTGTSAVLQNAHLASLELQGLEGAIRESISAVLFVLVSGCGWWHVRHHVPLVAGIDRTEAGDDDRTSTTILRIRIKPVSVHQSCGSDCYIEAR
jgi:hypothetical protein